MKYNVIKLNFNEIKFSIKEHFSAYKKCYIICAIFVVLGLLTGFFTAFKYAEYVTVEHLTDTSLIEYLRRNSGWLALLVSRIFSFSLIFGLIMLFSLNRWTVYLSFLVLLYRAYLIGLNSAILIILFNVSGAINVFIVYLPCNVFVLFSLIGITAIFLKNCLFFSKYRQNIFCNLFWHSNGNSIIIYALISVIACIIELILLPTFCSAFFLAF